MNHVINVLPDGTAETLGGVQDTEAELGRLRDCEVQLRRVMDWYANDIVDEDMPVELFDSAHKALKDSSNIIEGAVVSKRRASTIEPANELKWVAFKLVRFVFGEEGKVAEWTRGWRGQWKCTLTDSGLTHIERFRVACVRWEQQRIAEIQMQRS